MAAHPPGPELTHDLYLHIRVIISIVLGIAITRVLSGLAKFVQHPGKLKVYPVHLLWALIVLISSIHFWWWEFGLAAITSWRFELFLFVLFYAFLFALMANILFPDELEEYAGYQDYFQSRRGWFFGLLIVSMLTDWFDSAIKGHVVTTTTHKTLRGPRGGAVFTNDEAIAKKINSAVFPGLQGGPLMHVIAAKAVAFGEALRPDFKSYAAAIVENAKVLAATLNERGANLVSGGTDTHLALVDLTPLGVTGKDADEALERAAITCNKNGIPNDPLPPVKTSGIRVGSPAGTTRGFGPAEFREIGNMVADVLEGLRKNGEQGDAQIEANVRERVRALCERFPIYPEL